MQALSYILLASIAFAAPTFSLQWKTAKTVCVSRCGKSSLFENPVLLYLFAALQITTFIMMAINLQLQGFSLSSALSDPLSIGCKYLGVRYSGSIKSNIFGSIGTIANYASVVAAGLYLGTMRRRLAAAALLMLAIFPSLLYVILYADKGTIFLAAAFLFGAALVARVSAGSTNLLNMSTIAALVMTLLAIMPVVGVSFLNRAGDACDNGNRTADLISKLGQSIAIKLNEKLESIVVSQREAPKPQIIQPEKNAVSAGVEPEPRTITPEVGAHSSSDAASVNSAKEIKSPVSDQERPKAIPDIAVEQTKLAQEQQTGRLMLYVRSYAFAHLFAFSDWFDDYVSGAKSGRYVNPPGRTWGFWTFMTIGRHLDRPYAATLPDGYFGEYFKVENIMQSNIYTWFRGLIYDFGLVGSLIFLSLVGAMSALAYRAMLLRESAPLAGSIYIFLIGLFYQCYIISVLTWNSPFVVFSASFLIIWLCKIWAPRHENHQAPLQKLYPNV